MFAAELADLGGEIRRDQNGRSAMMVDDKVSQLEECRTCVARLTIALYLARQNMIAVWMGDVEYEIDALIPSAKMLESTGFESRDMSERFPQDVGSPFFQLFHRYRLFQHTLKDSCRMKKVNLFTLQAYFSMR